MPPQQQPPEASTSSVSSSALNNLQSQLQETQMSLAGHVDKFRILDSVLAEHEGFKQEIQTLRALMKERKRDIETRDQPAREEEYMSDDDDTRSVGTVVPHELDRVEEQDEESVSEDEERRRRRNELRPSTPEPRGGDSDSDEVMSKPSRQSVPEDIVQRLTTLSNQLESALELSRMLQAQQATTQTTIPLLESKVPALESLVQTKQSNVDAQAEAQKAALAEVAAAARIPAEERQRDRESITDMINEWKKGVEGKWSSVQEEWNTSSGSGPRRKRIKGQEIRRDFVY
jgi:hypothetical protein